MDPLDSSCHAGRPTSSRERRRCTSRSVYLTLKPGSPSRRVSSTQEQILGAIAKRCDPTPLILPCRTKDKHGRRPIDLVPQDETELRQVLRRAEAELQLDMGDVAEDDDGEPGSGSDDD